jgi:predicted methyltransferase
MPAKIQPNRERDVVKVLVVAAAVTLMAGMALAPAVAQQAQSGQAAVDESRGDALNDPAYRGPEVLAFIGVKPGDRVADIIAGRFTRALSRQVGSKGKIYAIEPLEVVKVHPQVLPLMNSLESQPGYDNIEIITCRFDTLVLPAGLDAVFIRQNYHDLHDRFMGPADVLAFDRKVYAALKPGGVFVVLDHTAAAESGLRDTETLHRIDPAAVKSEVTSAGFVFDGDSAVLANPQDPLVKNVFDPSIRGRTDQFLYRFRKPM